MTDNIKNFEEAASLLPRDTVPVEKFEQFLQNVADIDGCTP